MKILLVDGHYYAYRSFFAIRNLSNSKGEPTNAIYGFVKALKRMIEDTQCSHALILWDGGLPERRTAIQPQYKQQRVEMPADLSIQLDRIQQVTKAMGVASVTMENVEADDLLASYAIQAAAQKWEVVLATNDKDLFQIVTDEIRIYSTAKADVAGLKEEFALLDADCVQKKWGLPAWRIHEVLALTGDTADNIPGVPGVGTKTAVKLLNAVDSLDDLIAGISALPPSKIRDSLAASIDQIKQNREMVRLDLDLPLPVPLDALTITPDWPALEKEYAQLEFRTLHAEASAKATTNPQTDLFQLT